MRVYKAGVYRFALCVYNICRRIVFQNVFVGAYREYPAVFDCKCFSDRKGSIHGIYLAIVQDEVGLLFRVAGSKQYQTYEKCNGPAHTW